MQTQQIERRKVPRDPNHLSTIAQDEAYAALRAMREDAVLRLIALQNMFEEKR